jgi:hypothetical protein
MRPSDMGLRGAMIADTMPSGILTAALGIHCVCLFDTVSDEPSVPVVSAIAGDATTSTVSAMEEIVMSIVTMTGAVAPAAIVSSRSAGSNPSSVAPR